MKNRLTFIVGVLVVLVLLAYMFMFQVRYNEQAVVATFSRATEGSVVTEPGLRWRLPRPLQTVTKYSTMLQTMDDPMEQRTTADSYTIIVRDYAAWRITDPYKFYIGPRTEEKAEDLLSALMRDLSMIYGKYNFNQFVNTDPAQLKLREMEREAADFLNQRLGDTYGMRVEHVGIRRVLLPPDVTTKVFERMRDTRVRMAQNARSEGEAQARGIASEAEKIRDIILAFARGRAQAIEAEGDREAAEAYNLFSADPEFAIFLRQLETLRKALAAETTTLVMDADSLDVMRLFAEGPTPEGAEAPEAAAPSAPEQRGDAPAAARTPEEPAAAAPQALELPLVATPR